MQCLIWGQGSASSGSASSQEGGTEQFLARMLHVFVFNNTFPLCKSTATAFKMNIATFVLG